MIAFVSAVLALLLAPGPTNTLIAVAGAQGGWRRVTRLLPAELLGYLVVIVPLAWFGSALLAQAPALAAGLQLAAAAWVMLLAVRLWRSGPGADAGAEVTARKVLLTTMLNPKALIFGLVLLPAADHAEFAPKLALFAAMVVAVALVWGAAGALTRAGAGGAGRLHLTQRIASLWLGIVSISLVAGIVSA